jgi:hypothetical protein
MKFGRSSLCKWNQSQTNFAFRPGTSSYSWAYYREMVVNFAEPMDSYTRKRKSTSPFALSPSANFLVWTSSHSVMSVCGHQANHRGPHIVLFGTKPSSVHSRVVSILDWLCKSRLKCKYFSSSCFLLWPSKCTVRVPHQVLGCTGYDWVMGW